MQLGVLFHVIEEDLFKAHIHAHFRRDPKTGKLVFIEDYDDSRHAALVDMAVKKGQRVTVTHGKHAGKHGTVENYYHAKKIVRVNIDGVGVRPAAPDHIQHHGDREEEKGVKTIAKAIADDFKEADGSCAIGKKVKSAEDVAVLAQMWRNPQYETLRLIYVKKGKVVDHEGVTQRLPGSVKAFATGTKEEELARINARIKALGADGVYLLHNHPSGDPQPSPADYHLTKGYMDGVPELQGHVVINSGKYAEIELHRENVHMPLSLSIKPLPNVSFTWKDELLTPSVPHPAIGEEVNSGEKIAILGKRIHNTSKDMALMLYLDAGLRVRGLQEVSREAMKRAPEWIEKQLRSFGTSTAVVYDPEAVKGDMHDVYKHLVDKYYIGDAVADVDTSIMSVQGFGTWSDYTNHFAGKDRRSFDVVNAS